MKNEIVERLNTALSQNHAKRILSFLILFGVGVRLLFLLSIGNELRWYDENNYHSIAISIKQGNGFISTYNPYSTTHWAPLQGYVIAGIYSIAGNSPAAVRIFQDILSGGLLLLIYLLGRRFFSHRTGVLAAGIFAVHPIFIYVSNTLYPTLLFTILSVLSFWFLQKSVSEGTLVNTIIGGLLLGAAMLAKPVAIFYIPAILFGFWARWRMGRKFWLHGVFTTVFAMVAISPWIGYNYQKYGEFFFITQEGPHSFVAANNPEFELKDRGKIRVPEKIQDKVKTLDEEVRNKVYFQEALNYIKGRPVHFIKNYMLRFLTFWRLSPSTISKNVDTNTRNRIISFVFYSLLLPWSFLGMLFERKRWRDLSLLYGFIFFFAAGYAFFIPSIRYRLPIEPYLIIFAAVGFWCFWNRFIAKNSLSKPA